MEKLIQTKYRSASALVLLAESTELQQYRSCTLTCLVINKTHIEQRVFIKFYMHYYCGFFVPRSGYIKLNVIVLFFFFKPLLRLYSQNAPVEMLRNTQLHSQLHKQSEMKNTELVPTISFFSDQVGGVSFIRRFHFPPSRSDPSHSRSDPELWRSRKCRW